MRRQSEGSANSERALSDEAIDWIVKLQSGHATADDARAFRDWRGRSLAHEAAAQKAEAIWYGVGVAGEPAQQAERRKRVTRRAVLGGGAALVAGAAVMSSGVFRSFLADYATGSGEQRTITLADGSTVQLNASSAFSVELKPERRTITLHEGQATFAVAADAERPFIVRAAGGEARVLGTQFDVDIRDGKVFVTVIEGRVAVADTRQGQAELGANEQAIYGAAAPLSTLAVNAEQVTAWRRGRLVFENRRLDSVIAEIARQGSGTVLILNPEIAALETPSPEPCR
ncbi:sensor [Devosia yakushimensis]|uniref:Sensor n=1 Tax=Devosia yakushimensis TaxID=470028 RepID=A0ABQ5UGZ5_9HYPH|nr:FecR domain-containing protein [Devosia yakushimensis]GLQ10677.1 sensor [Devosia yakushimensis]